MKYTHILLRPGELFLKGKNQGFFVNKLVRNVKKICGVNDVKKLRGMFIVDYFKGCGILRRVLVVEILYGMNFKKR